MTQTDLRRGAAYAVLAGVFFSTMGALVKLTTGQLSTEMAVFLRNLFGLVTLSPWLLRLGISGLKTERAGSHLLRASLGLSAMYCFFYTFHHLPLATAMLLNYSAPIFLPLIAMLWLQEKPGVWVYPGALIGLAGVGLVLNPGTSGLLSMAGVIGLLSGILAAFAMASVRRISSTEPASRIVFYFTLLGVLLSGAVAALRWQTPAPPMLLIMFAAGVCATLGQLALTRAYSLGAAAQIGPLTYATVLFAALWGWGLWGENLTPGFMLGALLIVGGSTLALRGAPEPEGIPEELLPEELIAADLSHGRHGD